MTLAPDSVVITKIAHRCKDLVTNLMSVTDIRALVNSAILSYNSETPERTELTQHGPVSAYNITDVEDAVVSLLQSYVRGQLPYHMDRVISYEAIDLGDEEIVPEGEEIPQPTPEPSPVSPEPTPVPTPVTPTPTPSSYY